MGARAEHRMRDAALAGLAGSTAAVLLMGLVHTLVRPVPFPPVAMAQAFVRSASGQVESFFIERLGYWAERLAVIGATTGVVVSGAVLGIVLWRIFRPRSIPSAAWFLSLVPVWALSVVFYRVGPQFLGRWAFAPATLPIYLAGGAVVTWAYARLAAPAVVTDERRRMLLRSALLGTAGSLLGVSSLGDLLFSRPDPGRLMLHVGSLRRASTPAPTAADAAFGRISGLTKEVTSNESFYVVDESLIDPVIDPSTWRLEVGGLVRRPLSLSYSELKRFPAVERYQTLECISNEVGGHLMSTAKWVGVPLSEILDRAGVRRGAVEVVFRAAGGYSDSLSVDQAMDESTLIAIGMNDHVLPRAHGFPARLLSVGTYGMKNPKWLTSIEVVDRPYHGYWEQRGWSKRAIVRTGSRIDVPTSGAVVGREVEVAGVAFAGDRGVSRVEVSTDRGRTWRDADLKTALGPYTWRLWRHRFTPEPGQYLIAARAYDGSGRVQSDVNRTPFPAGSTGEDTSFVSQ